jgi:hypothetical protein
VGIRLLSDHDVIDWITDPVRLSTRVNPDFQSRFTALEEARSAYEDLATLTSWGRQLAGRGGMKRVASIPSSVMAAMLEVKPDLLQDRKFFYSWLDRNQPYQVYRRRRPRVDLHRNRG